MPKLKVTRDSVLTLCANTFFLWVIFQYALGGLPTGWLLLSYVGLSAWIALAIVTALVLYHSDYRTDIPLFIAGYGLGYWGEWWGTTRGVWTYSNGQAPPDYLPPLWAIGLLTVYHLYLLIRQACGGRSDISATATCNRSIRALKAALLILLPALAFAVSAPRLAAVDWSGKLDTHFVAGILVGVTLLVYHLDVDETFGLWLCGMLLGGIYETLGTQMREWVYITHEAPPVWIIPLWGLACVAMVKLSRLLLYLPKTAHRMLQLNR